MLRCTGRVVDLYCSSAGGFETVQWGGNEGFVGESAKIIVVAWYMRFSSKAGLDAVFLEEMPLR